MAGRPVIFTILEFERDRVHAVCASIGDGRVGIRGAFSKPYPDGVRLESPSALGPWIAAELKSAGMPRNRVVFSMPRGDVVLKRLAIPGVGLSEQDLSGMVRLQMSRQLTMPITETSIDYLPPVAERATAQPLGDAPAGGGGATTAAVMAGAMPSDRVSWCRDVAAAGDLTLRRIGLKCFGVAALLAELSQRRDGTVMGVALGSSTAEFVVVEDGQLVLARAVDVTAPALDTEREAYAERIAVEAKRTWMSHKSTRGIAEIERVALIGDGEPSRSVGAKCAVALECGCEFVNRPAMVDIAETITEPDLGSVLPGAGLVLEGVLGENVLDFANPRKARDLAAVRRQRVLLGVLGSIVLCGGAWVVGRSSLNDLRDQDAKLKDRGRELQAQVEKHLAQHARLAHIEQWSKARVEWLSYLDMLNQQLPEAKMAVLDGLGGQMTIADVEFASKGKPYPDGAWILKQEAAFSIDGRMVERRVAADLRGKLLDLPFDSVSSKGADVPDRFSFVLKTSLPAPKKTEPSTGAVPATGAAKEPVKPVAPAPKKEGAK